jgi:hypothetical protein
LSWMDRFENENGADSGAAKTEVLNPGQRTIKVKKDVANRQKTNFDPGQNQSYV